MIKRNNIYKEAPFVFQASISRLLASFSNHSFTTQKIFSLLFSLIFPPANQERARHGCAVAVIIVTMEQQHGAFSFRENDVRTQLKHHRRGLSLSLEKKKKTKSVGSDNPNPFTALGFRVRNLYGRTRFSNGPRMNSVEEDGVVVMNTNSVFGSSPEKMAEFAEKEEEIEAKNVGGIEEKGRESSCSSDFLVSETTRPGEQSPSSTEDSTSCPISPRWSVQNGGGAKKPGSDSGKMQKQRSGISEIEMMKERFSKLLLGEDMSGSGNGVSTALAISNAITNLCATLFGQLWRLEPLPPEKKAMWRREMEWLLCVSDHIVEMTPSWQTFPDGSKLEIMTCRPRSDLYVNLPALRKLDNMLLEILESFKNTEFWYVDQGISAHEPTDGSTSFRRVLQRQEEKWWLPVPRVPPGGLHENSRKQLQHKRDCTNQILKAVMAINSITLVDMEIPESYLESLPKNGRACLGDLIYRYISSDQFSPECLLDCLDLSSEHQAIEIANRVEASIYLWRKRTNSKLTHSTSKSSSRSSWEMVKELMVDAEKRELLADRSESLLLSLKQRFPGLPQTALDMSKIQCNKDVGKSILEGYSRVLESLAFNIVARIDDLLYVDNLTRHSDQLPKMGGAITHKSVALPISAYATPSYSPAKVERSSATSSPLPFKIPSTSSVKRVLTDYLTADPRSKDSGALSSRSSPSQSQSDPLSLEQYMKESLSVSKLDPGI